MFKNQTLNLVIVDPVTHKKSKGIYPVSRGTFREKEARNGNLAKGFPVPFEFRNIQSTLFP